MVGIIVMTHGTLSEGIVDAAELITGPVTQVETLSLRREDNVNDLNAAFLAALDRVDTGDGVLVLADLLGGSPCNVASMNLRERSYRVLSGVAGLRRLGRGAPGRLPGGGRPGRQEHQPAARQVAGARQEGSHAKHHVCAR